MSMMILVCREFPRGLLKMIGSNASTFNEHLFCNVIYMCRTT